MDMKYATQSMEYEVRSMKRARKERGKSDERARKSGERTTKERGKEQGRAREEPEKNEGRGIRASDIPDERHPAAQCSGMLQRKIHAEIYR